VAGEEEEVAGLERALHWTVLRGGPKQRVREVKNSNNAIVILAFCDYCKVQNCAKLQWIRQLSRTPPTHELVGHAEFCHPVD
jgi:hypothetical protein